MVLVTFWLNQTSYPVPELAGPSEAANPKAGNGRSAPASAAGSLPLGIRPSSAQFSTFLRLEATIACVTAHRHTGVVK